MKINITQGREIEKIRSEYSPGDKEIIKKSATDYVDGHSINPFEETVIKIFKNEQEWPVISYLLETDSNFKLMFDTFFYEVMDVIEAAKYALEVSENRHEPLEVE